jgi:hypothetical protein
MTDIRSLRLQCTAELSRRRVLYYLAAKIP